MLITKIIDGFIEERSAISRSETVRYIKDQTNSLNKFFNTFNIVDFNDLKKEYVLEFIQLEKKKKNTNVTINKKISVLKRLIKFSLLYEQELTKDLNMILNLPKLREHSISYPTLTNEQLEKVIHFYNGISINDFRDYRLKIILGVLLSTGCRATELLNIKINNINLNTRKIYLEHTKTEKPRYAYFPFSFADILEDYILRYNNEYLITNYEGEYLGINALTCIFKRLTIKLGFKVSPHIIRHTFATKQLQNGIDIESLRKLMGHTRLTTTQIYLTLNDTYVKTQYDKYNVWSSYGGK